MTIILTEKEFKAKIEKRPVEYVNKLLPTHMMCCNCETIVDFYIFPTGIMPACPVCHETSEWELIEIKD